jgi:hypothetical protein
MTHRANILLVFFGVGLALVVGLAFLFLSGQGVVLAACQPASGDWSSMVYRLMGDFREPCADFYWLPEPDDEFHNHIRLNNYGLHDTLLSLEKPGGVYRVLVVGDSMAQGWQVSLEEGFPYLVEQQLSRNSGRPVEVVNLSVDSYGTDRELLLYSLLGWRFQPDLVLLAIYTGNDVQDNEIDLETRRYGYRLERPFFTLEDGTLSLHHSPIFSPARYETSAAYLWLTRSQAQQGFLPRENPPPAPRVVSDSPYMLEYPVELGLYLPEDRYWSNAWALTEALIVQMRDLAEAQGSRFATVIIPDRRAVHSEDWASTLHDHPFLQAVDPVESVNRMEELLARHEITSLNMTWDLRAWLTRNPGQRLYYEQDGHFNVNGHAVTAQRLASWLRAEELVP